MRVPWWLRKATPEQFITIQRRVNRALVHNLDDPQPFAKYPAHFQRRFMERRHQEPVPVHYKPVEVPYEYDPEIGEIVRIEDTVPILPMFPPESHYGLWGGEGMVKGFIKRLDAPYMKKTAKWWYPKLSQVTLYSEVLDKYLLTIVTQRTLELIEEAKGFDFYLLKTHEVDLQSRLGLRLKGEVLRKLAAGDLYPDDPEKNSKIRKKYKAWTIPEEEAAWVGLSLEQAEAKYNAEQYAPPAPLKEVFREQLLLELHKLKLEGHDKDSDGSWTTRLNPFGKRAAANA
ncbi:putative 39S ribosomal protein L28, mitochondrial [Hypsibius exemplaris]|uniref:Large ribosomal subunit protein bL28m n=1 Tax=Hypsibius exemplaris TaxID=2072580 RepID=A0A9X6NN39_HYPEX|nr:putative 39S ribosomal protein L28, mitochondrial [Hypsibius exemplaris]